MKFNFATALMLLTVLPAIATTELPDTESFGKKESFVIKGKVSPDFGKKFSIAVSGYLNNNGIDLPVNQNGEFCETITMEGPLQEIYIYVDKTVTIPVAAGDTVVADYIDNKLTLSSPDREYDSNLKFAKLKHDMLRKRYIGINRSAYGDIASDSSRHALIDSIDCYISDYNTLLHNFEKENGTLSKREYFVNDAYFSPMHFIARDKDLLDSINAMPDSKQKGAYRKLSAAQMIYPSVRNFAISYIRDLSSETCRKVECDDIVYARIINIARAIAPDPFVADLVNASQLHVDMLFASYPDIEPYADSTIGNITTTWVKEQIADEWDRFKITAPGCELPKLVLTDMDGKNVPIERFKGKVVLLDFWAIGCGPCVMEFKKMEEFKSIFADKKDDLRIITVCCMTPSKETWKKAIDKYSMNDINTMLDPEESAEIYSKLGWPTYVLIGRDGKIFEWNTMRPSIIIGMKKRNRTTTVDEALAAD
ncbi:MAG: TlpA family protein disulfide reductase [Duncaniella sp.]|nr:TlpA family protein disulfide reductase [Duncaniella sp.]